MELAMYNWGIRYMYKKIDGDKVRFFIFCGMDSNGKKIIRTRQHKLPKGLPRKKRYQLIKKWGDQFENEVLGGSSIEIEKMRFKEFVLGEYETDHLSHLKPKTAQDYREIINKRLMNYFGDMWLTNITTLDVKNWLSQLKRADGSRTALSDNSKGVWFRTLSAILGKAEEWGRIESNPCKKLKQPRKPQSDVRALEEADVIKIFSKFGECPDIRKVILMKVLLLTGMRSSECAGLEWRDLDCEQKSLKVERESIYVRGVGVCESTPKSKSARRIVFIPEELVNDLKDYRAVQEKWIEERGDLWIGEKGDTAKLFPQFNGLPVSNFTIRSWVKKFLKWCGVPYVPPHGLRHTYASILIAEGVDARTTAAQLGHSKPSLIYDTYANPQKSAKRKAADLLGSIVTKKNDEE